MHWLTQRSDGTSAIPDREEESASGEVNAVGIKGE
jgi:hypothetical protein